MKIRFHRDFDKKYVKLPPQIKLKIKERNLIFENNPFDPILSNHALKGKYQGHRSINITGDWRVIYKLIHKDTALFINIDTHSNLYK